MAGSEKRRILVVIRHSPYGSSLAKASLDVALAGAAFEQAIDLLFMGDGILQLLPGQDSRELGIRNAARQLSALPLYDIECVYVDSEAVARYGVDLSMAPVGVRALDADAIRQLMSSYDHLLGF